MVKRVIIELPPLFYLLTSAHMLRFLHLHIMSRGMPVKCAPSKTRRVMGTNNSTALITVRFRALISVVLRQAIQATLSPLSTCSDNSQSEINSKSSRPFKYNPTIHIAAVLKEEKKNNTSHKLIV